MGVSVDDHAKTPFFGRPDPRHPLRLRLCMRHFREAETQCRNYQEVVNQTTVCFIQTRARSEAPPVGSFCVRLRSSMAKGCARPLGGPASALMTTWVCLVLCQQAA